MGRAFPNQKDRVLLFETKMIAIKRVTKKKRLFGIRFSSRGFMSFIYVVKCENQEYRASNIEYVKQYANEIKNEAYKGDGKAQGGEQSIEEEWVINEEIDDVWDNRAYCGDHQVEAVCISIIFTDEVPKDEHSDGETGVDGCGQIHENI